MRQRAILGILLSTFFAIGFASIADKRAYADSVWSQWQSQDQLTVEVQTKGPPLTPRFNRSAGVPKPPATRAPRAPSRLKPHFNRVAKPPLARAFNRAARPPIRTPFANAARPPVRTPFNTAARGGLRGAFTRSAGQVRLGASGLRNTFTGASRINIPRVRASFGAATGTPHTRGPVQSFRTTKPMTLYRVYSGNATRGSFLTKVKPGTSARARSKLALPQGNKATHIQKVVLPAGTWMVRSRIAPAFGQRGGGVQYRLQNSPPRGKRDLFNIAGNGKPQPRFGRGQWLRGGLSSVFASKARRSPLPR